MTDEQNERLVVALEAIAGAMTNQPEQLDLPLTGKVEPPAKKVAKKASKKKASKQAAAPPEEEEETPETLPTPKMVAAVVRNVYAKAGSRKADAKAAYADLRAEFGIESVTELEGKPEIVKFRDAIEALQY